MAMVGTCLVVLALVLPGRAQQKANITPSYVSSLGGRNLQFQPITPQPGINTGLGQRLIFKPVDTKAALRNIDAKQIVRQPQQPASTLGDLKRFFRAFTLPSWPPKVADTPVLPQDKNVFQPKAPKGKFLIEPKLPDAKGKSIWDFPFVPGQKK
jgi:hypothetical protein